MMPSPTPTFLSSNKRKRSFAEPTRFVLEPAVKASSDEFRSNLLRLYREGILTDITFSIQQQEFRAHRVVLAASNSFLGAMILSGMSETKQDVVQLDADRSLFGFILRHIYGEVIEVELSQLVPLLGMAASFSMSNLRDQLANILANHISIDNCCSILATADLLTCSNLKCVAENVLHRNFAAVSRTDTFLELDVDMVEHILRSDEITDCDESVVFESVVRWLHYYEDTRKEFKELMLSLIRFPLMDSGYLSDVIKMHPIMHRPDQSDLLLEAFEHHALLACGRRGLSTPRTRKRKQSCSFSQFTALNGHSDAVSSLLCHGDIVISGSWDATIKVWATDTWICIRTLSDHAGAIRSLCVCADKVISCSDDGVIKVWSPGHWTCVRSMEGHSSAVNALIDSRGRLVSAGDDGTVKLWSSNAWSCEVTVHHIALDSLDESEEDSNAVQHVGVICLEAFDDKLISGCDDSTVRIWNTNTWICEQILRGHQDEVWSIKLLGKSILTGSVDGKFCVWSQESSTFTKPNSSENLQLPMEYAELHPVKTDNVSLWQCQHQVLTDGPIYAICCLDGKVVTAGSSDKISIWRPSIENVEDWTLLKVLETEGDGVWTLTACKGRLVSGDMDGIVRVWT